MATKTDSFGFNQTKLFQIARDCSPDDHKHTQNLVESQDDMIYVWNAKNCCIMALNWRAAASRKQEEFQHQTLIPSTPQNFTVEKILPSTDGTFVALAGPKGVSIIELPRRWGPNGQYQNGKECIICRAYNLDEHLFTDCATLELLQIRWHPASPTDSHLLVLLSDNSIRVYDADSLRHVWRIGPTPTPQPVVGVGGGGGGKRGNKPGAATGSPGNVSSSPGVTSKLAYLNSLGDTAVDFDIAPPRVVSSATGGSGSFADTTFPSSTILSTTSSTATAAKAPITPKEGTRMNESLIAHKNKKLTTGDGSKVEWPIVILRGDGNVYVLCAGIDTNRPRLQGPISIQPQVDDNYGLDSCSLIVIPTLPPTVIIAETTGKTHHALFLEETCPLDRSQSSDLLDNSLAVHPCEWYLHVLETVELELGLPSVEEAKAAKSYSCPLHLKRDPLNEARYFVYHNAGLHAITLDFTRPLHEFVEQDGGEDMLEKYPLFSSHSRAEYVVCTKALPKAKTNAVLGFTLLQSPPGLVLFLASGQVVSLDLISDPSLIRKWPLNVGKAADSVTDLLPGGVPKGPAVVLQMLKDSFQKRIQAILKSGLTQPILKLDPTTEPTPQEAFELLTQATRMLRESYFVRHEKARQELENRQHVLKLLKQQQLADIDELKEAMQDIRAMAERMAETYEDQCDKQNALFKRAQEIVRLATLRLPKGSFAEKQFTEKIEKINQSVNLLQKNVDQVKQKIAAQQMQLDAKKTTSKEKSFTLPIKQEEIIKKIIGEMYAHIDGNVKDVKKMNSILNLS